jgi:malate permease and related proteins
MSSFWTFMQEMLVLYGMAGVGFIVRKTGILNEHANQVLTQLILFVTLPALILFSLDISFSSSIVPSMAWLILMSVFILAASCLLAFFMGRYARLPTKEKAVYQSLIIFGNQGFIGYAVIYILFQQEGIIYLTLFNLCYLVLIWTYGVYLFTSNKQAINWRSIFLNPGILSTLTGLAILLTPLQFPEPVQNGLESVGKMTIPLSMMVIGSLIANVNLRGFLPSLKNSYLWKAAVVRLLVIPLLLVSFAFFSMPSPLLNIAVIVSGMPSAPTTSLYAQKYGADPVFASFGVLLSTLLCVVTIPFLYFISTFFGILF